MKKIKNFLWKTAVFFGDSFLFFKQWPTPIGRLFQIICIPLNMILSSLFLFIYVLISIICWIIYGDYENDL